MRALRGRRRLAARVSPSRPRRPAPPNGSAWATRSPPGPLIPSQTLLPARLPALEHELRPARRGQHGKTLTDVSCSGARTTHMTARRARTRAPTRRSSTRSPPTRGRVAADRRQRHRLHRDPPELRDLQPVRAAVPEPLLPGGDDETAQPDRRHRAEGRAPSSRASARSRRTRASWSSTTRRSCPTSGSGCWPQVPLACADVPYVRRKQKQLNTMLAAQATGDNGPARRRLHGEHRPRRVQVLGHALGRAAGAGQRRRAVPSQRPRHAGHRSGGRGGGAVARAWPPRRGRPRGRSRAVGVPAHALLPVGRQTRPKCIARGGPTDARAVCATIGRVATTSPEPSAIVATVTRRELRRASSVADQP